MSQKLQPLIINNFNKGIYTNINASLVSPETLRFSINMFNDSINSSVGTLSSRGGISNDFGFIDEDIAAVDNNDEIYGLFGYGGGNLIAAVDTIGGSIYTYLYNTTTAAWVDIGAVPFAWTPNIKMRFEYFINYVFACDGVQIKSWDGIVANNWGATNLASAPVAYYAKVFQGKLFTAPNFSRRLNFSSLPDPVTNLITWDTAHNYIEFNTGDADFIRGLERNGNLLLIFTQRNIFTYDGVSTQSEPLYRVGAVNQETIQTIGTSTFFLSQGVGSCSVYEYSGSYPVDISEPVREFLKWENITGGLTTPVFGEWGSWSDENNFYLSIGDVTIDGEVFQNIVLCYSTIQKSWSVMSFEKKTGTVNNFFAFSTKFTSAGTGTSVYLGDGVGYYEKKYVVIAGTPLGTINTNNLGISPAIWKPATAFSDSMGGTSGTNQIKILIQTHKLDFGSRARKKTINKFNVYANKNYGNIKLFVRINETGGWNCLGGLTDKTTLFDLDTEGNIFEFRLSGISVDDKFVFEGFEFFGVDIDDYEL